MCIRDRFIAGWMCTLSRNTVKRALKYAAAALVVWIATCLLYTSTVSNETAGATENTNNGGQTSNNNNQGGNTPAPK